MVEGRDGTDEELDWLLFGGCMLVLFTPALPPTPVVWRGCWLTGNRAGSGELVPELLTQVSVFGSAVGSPGTSLVTGSFLTCSSYTPAFGDTCEVRLGVFKTLTVSLIAAFCTGSFVKGIGAWAGRKFGLFAAPSGVLRSLGSFHDAG